MDLSQSSDSLLHLIKDLQGDQGLILRLMELGFTRGEGVRVVGRSIFGTPIFVEIRGTVLALRENEAKCIMI